MDYSSYSDSNRWYKGNLHCHTTISDGLLDPKEAADLYKRRGWDFLALTDHEKYSHWEEFNTADFLILPGVEIGVRHPESRFKCHHVVGLHQGSGVPKHMEQFTSRENVQESMDQLHADGYMAIYCHPVWSRIEFFDMEDIKGFCGIEIYNNTCELDCHTGYAVHHWDALLRRGRRIWGVASDDAHHRLADQCGGWVMVNAPCLTKDAIMEALEEGRFYSSTGPSIRRFEVRNQEVFVECSPVRSIHFVTYERRGNTHHAEGERTISTAVHKLRGDETYIRVECVDELGRTAWSNPIFLTDSNI